MGSLSISLVSKADEGDYLMKIHQGVGDQVKAEVYWVLGSDSVKLRELISHSLS